MRPQQRLDAHIAAVIRDTISTETGSLLVFLPGAGEIRRVEEQLRGTLPGDVLVQPLHGSLPFELQDAALRPAPPGKRKVVLATSIAETSLTIEGIRVVIDSGQMRIPRFSARTGMTRLETVRVSRASADQRRGRAGRLEPGVCVRAWSAGEDAGLVPYTRPEILDADLAGLVLDLASAGFSDPAELHWLDSPPAAAFAQGRELLQLLGAIDSAGRITAHGRAMAEMGAHPRLAHMLVRARDAGSASLAIAETLVEILEERDVMRGNGGPPPADIELRLGAQRRGAHGSGRTSPGMLIAYAYPDRVAQRRDAPGRFLLRNGRGAMLAVTDPLAHAEWIVAAQIDDAGREGRIMLAAALDPVELLEHAREQIEVRDEIAWNDATRSVTARRRTMLGALVLNDSAISEPDSAAVLAALLDGIRRTGVDALPWSDSVVSLGRRIAFLHQHDATWPDVSDDALAATLDHWLGPRVAGVRKLDAIPASTLGDALRDLLSWEQRRLLDELAPERIEVPTGSRIAIDYADPAAPTLAVRLQEVFGMTETPRVGRGVQLTMQLLSPGYRPVQTTRDLASFWKSGYFDVRKDLRGRYPKHHWPEDPLTATAVRGPNRKRRV